MIYIWLDNVKLAIADCTKAIELKPKYAEAYGDLGLVYLALNKKDEAIRNLRRAATLFKEQKNLALYNYVQNKLAEI